MTAAETRARKLVAARTTAQLLNDWDLSFSCLRLLPCSRPVQLWKGNGLIPAVSVSFAPGGAYAWETDSPLARA